MTQETQSDKYDDLTTYGPVNQLYRAAVALLKSMPSSAISPELTALRNTVEVCRHCISERELFSEAIDAAVEKYTGDSLCNIEIDADPLLSVGDGGVWVSAWVWVPDAEGDEDVDDGEGGDAAD